MPCNTCISYVALDSSSGECHFRPLIPIDEGRLTDETWPIVAATDECNQFVAGSHPGTECTNCQRLHQATRKCRGRQHPLGTYRGRISEYPVQKDEEKSCTVGFLAI